MVITTVLFDLDGTLLPMDQEAFTKRYFGLLAAKLAPYGYDSKELIDGIWHGTAAMVSNTGVRTNEAAFWDDFVNRYGEKVRNDMHLFQAFYKTEFDGARSVCGFNPLAAQTVQKIKAMGFRVALATNPIFPAIATEKRIQWAGLCPNDFEIYTTYENSSYCKPNPDYFREVAARLKVRPEACLMVGNDATEDLAAQMTGMTVFLLTDCLINQENRDISAYPHGDFQQLQQYLERLQ